MIEYAVVAMIFVFGCTAQIQPTKSCAITVLFNTQGDYLMQRPDEDERCYGTQLFHKVRGQWTPIFSWDDTRFRLLDSVKDHIVYVTAVQTEALTSNSKQLDTLHAQSLQIVVRRYVASAFYAPEGDENAPIDSVIIIPNQQELILLKGGKRRHILYKTWNFVEARFLFASLILQLMDIGWFVWDKQKFQIFPIFSVGNN